MDNNDEFMFQQMMQEEANSYVDYEKHMRIDHRVAFMFASATECSS
jgi:hypothetical protein